MPSLVRLIVAASLLLATFRAAGAEVTLSVILSLEPVTGSLTAEVRIPAPRGDVILPDIDWLEVTGLRVAGETPIPSPDARIDPEIHMGRPLSVSFSGILPELSRDLGPAARAAGASYLVGDAWLPRDGRDSAGLELVLDVPADHRALATGSLIDETLAGGRYVARFLYTGRREDLGVFAGRYQVGEAMRDGLRLRTYFAADDHGLSEAYLEAAAAHIARYADEIGPYPYDGFSVVSAPIPVGLGFPGLTYVSQTILGHDYMRGRSLAHEVLHGWWGNAVGVDYGSGNWAEGLTTFQSDHALAEAEGPEAAREMRLDWLRGLASLPDDARQPLRAFRSAAHDGRQAEGYGKAALVFHMLRAEIGEATFAAGLRRFYAAHRASIAGWDDLRAAFEAEAGRDLGGFFEQWLERAGLPRITLSGAEPVESDGGPALRLTLAQDGPAYRLSVPVRVETASGSVNHRIRLDGETTEVLLPLDAPPRTVQVDPGFDLARALLPGEAPPILAELFAARRVMVVTPEGDAETVAVAEAASRRLLRGREVAVSDAAAVAGAPVALIVGATGAVAALRDRLIDAPAPWDMTFGSARVWAERTPDANLRVFLSADHLPDLETEIAGLRYHARRSHVAFAGGKAVMAGTWPATASPLRITFD